ncbi:MAG: EVE domain-containing protein [Actinomycetota bacterium]|nr:EVE domain-containing protein [Actinomycetota bacterium]
MRFWINTVSRDHVRAGVEGRFTQADHGRQSRLRRLAKGDFIAFFYSLRTAFRNGEPLQAFTAIARVVDDAPYQVEMAHGFHPWRRRVEFLTTDEAPVRPLIDRLDVIKDKKRWGYAFRAGLFEVSRTDFEQICAAMNVSAPAPRDAQ